MYYAAKAGAEFCALVLFVVMLMMFAILLMPDKAEGAELVSRESRQFFTELGMVIGIALVAVVHLNLRRVK